MRFHRIILPLAAILAASCSQTGTYTRGIGVYPGNPDEYSGPEAVTGNAEYRNLALKRAAWHSSSYDYNLPAQLATGQQSFNCHTTAPMHAPRFLRQCSTP